MARTLTDFGRDLQWIAGKDGIAHGNRGHERTLCGRLPLPIRYAWPALERCSACELAMRKLEEVPPA